MPTHRVPSGHPPGRLDAFVAGLRPDLSRRLVHHWIAEGLVRVDGQRARKGSVVRPEVTVTIPDAQALVGEDDLRVALCAENAWMVAIDKPGGMPSHALDPRERGTAANVLAARFPETRDVGRPGESGLVHRLDTGTSGVLIAARTSAAYAALRSVFHDHTVTKHYVAIVRPRRSLSACTIELPLAHDPGDRQRMRVADGSERRQWAARSTMEPVRQHGELAVVRVTIRTGVTHQIRVHLAHVGCPVVGDVLYGVMDPRLGEGRHALHAEAVELPAGPWGDAQRIEAPLAPDLMRLAPA